ncbi:MAG: hypothetical protein ACXVPQ_02815 [Bacteroidia bacterium]
METNLDEFLKHQLSAQEADIAVPPLERVSDARRIVEARKWKPVKKQLAVFALPDFFLFPKKGIYQAGLLSMIIAGYFFCFTLSNTVYYNETSSLQNEALNSANSNTLASLTHTSISSPVQSSTVLPSIFTFASQN